jgi:transcriptional regulator with XRE-family HTH domain
MAEPLKAFGRNVRKLRMQKGLSQEKLADICGLHRTYVGGIERGERNLGLRNVVCLAKALEVPPSELLRDLDRGKCTEPAGRYPRR